MPLFGKSQRTPTELVKNLTETLHILQNTSKDERKYTKALEETSKILASIKVILYGTNEQEPQPELVTQVGVEFSSSGIIPKLINNLAKFDFEAKKDVVMIYASILRRQIGARYPTVDYVVSKPDILLNLIKGYDNPDTALNSGMMLRESIRYEALAKIILDSNEFFKFFEYVETSTFDIASDAFSTFKELLTRHKLLSSNFLEENYDKVFDHYKVLLGSENYVTKRQSLKLLGELLLDRHNFVPMTKYISNPENLKLMMTLLRDKSRNIQFEAFHVFKVFVANPNKSQPTRDILLKNKDKLVEFLLQFHTDRTEDEQFMDEKTYLIKQIRELK